MSFENPLLGMAVYSLTNAIELYEKNNDPNTDARTNERRRFGAIILMDLSVEYILKAKIFDIDATEFMDKEKELGFWDVMNDDRITFLEGEKRFLGKTHEARNLSQHRGVISDSLSSQQYMQWLCSFVNRFAKDNFNVTILPSLPVNSRVIWRRLTQTTEKPTKNEPILNEPLDEKYSTVRIWLNSVRGKSRRGYLSQDHKTQFLHHLRRYCKFLTMNPDQVIEYSTKGYVSPTEDIYRYYKTLPNPNAIMIALKSFYTCFGINVKVPYRKVNKYKPNTIKELTTEQIRQICDLAPIRIKSWIIANSYMGLKIARLQLLKVDDFHISNWDTVKTIYPVTIRKEVSSTYDYTTFIGKDAKNILQDYFKERSFVSQDHPWSYRSRSSFDTDFQTYCKKIGIYEKGKTVPRSLEKRLKRVLNEADIRQDWFCYLFGVKSERREIVKPLDDQLSAAYEKALPKLEIY